MKNTSLKAFSRQGLILYANLHTFLLLYDSFLPNLHTKIQYREGYKQKKCLALAHWKLFSTHQKKMIWRLFSNFRIYSHTVDSLYNDSPYNDNSSITMDL
jgi:hypothetical protein